LALCSQPLLLLKALLTLDFPVLPLRKPALHLALPVILALKKVLKETTHLSAVSTSVLVFLLQIFSA
jgi:hypothetical protein